MDFEIKDFTATVLDRGVIRSEMVPAWTATVKFANGDWVGVSRYVDEDYWIADCAFRGNGFPLWSNGTGTRVTAWRALDDDSPQVKQLDARRLHPAYQHR